MLSTSALTLLLKTILFHLLLDDVKISGKRLSEINSACLFNTVSDTANV
jgi:hypothetical protein